MSDRLSTQDIIDLLVATNQLNRDEAEAFVDHLFNEIEKGLSTDELVKIKDLGSFKLTHIQERESVDVNTQKKIVIPAHRRVTFSPAQLLKDTVNKPFAHFETTPLNDGVLVDGVNQEDDDKEIQDESPAKDKVITAVNESNEKPIETEESSNVEKVENDEVKEQNHNISKEQSASAVNKDAIPDTSKNIDASKKEKFKSSTTIEDSPRSRGKRRRYILRWDVAIAIVLIFLVGFGYNYFIADSKPTKHSIDQKDISKSDNEQMSASSEKQEETADTAVTAPIDVVEKTDKAVETVKMSPGRTLRLIALEKFGNKEFWVYIYMKNKDKIKDPDVIPVGLIMTLPSKDEYPMNADDPEDVKNAKTLGDEVLKRFD